MSAGACVKLIYSESPASFWGTKFSSLSFKFCIVVGSGGTCAGSISGVAGISWAYSTAAWVVATSGLNPACSAALNLSSASGCSNINIVSDL